MSGPLLSRRGFAGCCASCTGLFGLGRRRRPVCEITDGDEAPALEATVSPPPIIASLSDEEEQVLAASRLAAEIQGISGHSCAETILLAALRYLDQPESWLYPAACFGGGMGHGDLCGLLTGSYMALGIAAGLREDDRKAQKRRARETTRQFWTWWESMAPLHCRELRPQYDAEGYLAMKRRVAAKLEELIEG